MKKNYAIEPGKKYQIGDVTFETIVEVSYVFPWQGMKVSIPKANIVPEEMQWLVPAFATENFELRIAVQSFLIKSQGKNILVDTGMNVPGPTYENNLKAAGCTPEDIDYVMFTHLHYDHTARNNKMSVNGTLAPTFPNARYLFVQENYDFVKELQDNPAKRRGSPEYDHLWPFRTQMLSLVEQGKVDFIDYTFTLHDVISLYPIPGHMPGQVAFLINSKGDSAFIAGDIFHHPFQMTQIDASTSWDHDPVLSTRTREKVFGELAGTDTLFWAAHAVSGGFVVKADKGYQLIAH